MRIARILHLTAMVAAFALGAVAARAQAQTPPDFSKVEIKATKLGNNFYTLE